MRQAVTHLKRSDPVLAALIERVGPCRMQYGEPVFENLARSIVYQQLNGRAAQTIWNRVAEAAGGEVLPERILKVSEESLRAAGLSKQKLSYLRSLAEESATGRLNFAALPAMSDAEVIATLTQVKGIGVWTAQMFLMFALRRPDVLPTGDYGIRAAIQKLYRKRQMPKPVVIERIGKPWRPYASFACWYLWRSLDQITPEM